MAQARESRIGAPLDAATSGGLVYRQYTIAQGEMPNV